MNEHAETSLHKVTCVGTRCEVCHVCLCKLRVNLAIDRGAGDETLCMLASLTIFAAQG